MSASPADGRLAATPLTRGARDSPPGGRARLFVAVNVGDTVRAEVARVIQAIRDKIEAVKTPPRVVWVKPSALHVTLRFIGDVDEAAVPSLCERLAPPFAMAPFDVEWRGVGAFPSTRHPRALWLGVVGGGGRLGELEAEVTRRLAGTIDPVARPLLPHLTLGRIKMAGAGMDWPKVLQAIEVRGARSPVDRVTLYRSHLSHQGPHYTGLVSAPLTADRA
jgi:2'-5' RNA ligase